MGFTAYWDYIPTDAVHAGSPDVYSRDTFLNITIIEKIHLKCDVIDGSLVNNLRQPRLFSFDSNKPAGCKLFGEPETKHFKKINDSVLNAIPKI